MSSLSEDGFIKEEDKVEERGSLVGIVKCNQLPADHISSPMYIYILHHTKLIVFLINSILKYNYSLLSLRLIPSVVAAVVSRHESAAVKTLRPQGDKEEGEEAQGEYTPPGESHLKSSLAQL